MPVELTTALQDLRPLLLDLDHLVRAVATGARRGTQGRWPRVELRPVALAGGVHLQVVLSERAPVTRNHLPGAAAQACVEELLAEPFATWFVETDDRVVQVRVTKRGQAQVHVAPPVKKPVGEGDSAGPGGHDRVREHLLDPGDPIFSALGAGADKRRQVDAFLRLLAPTVERALSAVPAGEPLTVVDLGCGNAYLTFAAHRYLTDRLRAGAVRTVGVDVRPDMVARNRELAGALGLAGLEFAEGTIADALTDRPDLRPTVVLALHACDTATDDALARAVAWSAPVVLAAPCCHHTVHRQIRANLKAGVPAPEPYAAMIGQPILAQRFADVLTDTLRAELLREKGYRVDVVEFVDSRHTPRNALIRAVRRSGGAVAGASGAGEAAGAGGAPGTGEVPGTGRTSAAALAEAWHVHPPLAERLAALGGADRSAHSEGIRIHSTG